MNQPRATEPILFVVSAPSGAGKTTLCSRLLAAFPRMRVVITCTTRAPRPGETQDRSYHFLTPEAFEQRVREGLFLEHAEVHGARYGTLRKDVERILRDGCDVLLNVDVQGARSIRTFIAEAADDDPLKRELVDIFIMPPNLRELQLRLFGRGQDDEAVIARRLRNAEEEMKHWRAFRYLVVNDRLDDATDALRAIVVAEHCRTHRLA